MDSCCKKGEQQQNFKITTQSGRVITSYKTPLDAYNNGEREKLLYTVALPIDETKPDYIVTIDTDPQSKTYSQVIGRLPMPNVGDELHHTGWNACASCKGDQSRKHGYLIVPSMVSGNIYVIDVLSDPYNPKLHVEIPGKEVLKETGGSFPHTAHCLPSGDIMISFMGKESQKSGGGFLILDGQTFKIKGRWENESKEQLPYGYDFWYQPGHNIMVSSEFGEPGSFIKGFDPSAVQSKYGNTLTFWDWEKKTIIDKIALGDCGLIPLELRFLHNPKQNFGYVGAALSSTLVRFFNNNNKWQTEVVAQITAQKVKGWALDYMPGLITDILISLDDRFLYASVWLHGCVNQYNIEDPSNPKLVGQIYLGGSLQKGGPVMPIDEDGKERPDLLHEIPTVKGNKLQGAPQMLQLSLDGKRMFVTSSLLRPWDKQFYPEMTQKGGQIIQLDVDTLNGGLKLNDNFYVNFDKEEFGPAVAHEMRYPGGDCSSDIWI